MHRPVELGDQLAALEHELLNPTQPRLVRAAVVVADESRDVAPLRQDPRPHLVVADAFDAPAAHLKRDVHLGAVKRDHLQPVGIGVWIWRLALPLSHGVRLTLTLPPGNRLALTFSLGNRLTFTFSCRIRLTLTLARMAIAIRRPCALRARRFPRAVVVPHAAQPRGTVVATAVVRPHLTRRATSPFVAGRDRQSPQDQEM